MADDSKQKQDDNNDSKRRGKARGKSGAMSGAGGGLMSFSILPVIAKALGSRKHGGPIKKTGAYLVHKGETVVPAGKTRIVGTSSGHALPAKHRSTKKAKTKIVASLVRK